MSFSHRLSTIAIFQELKLRYKKKSEKKMLIEFCCEGEVCILRYPIIDIIGINKKYLCLAKSEKT
jgi:hypothetical protein